MINHDVFRNEWWCITFGIILWFVHTTDDVHVQGLLKWYYLTR